MLDKILDVILLILTGIKNSGADIFLHYLPGTPVQSKSGMKLSVATSPS